MRDIDSDEQSTGDWADPGVDREFERDPERNPERERIRWGDVDAIEADGRTAERDARSIDGEVVLGARPRVVDRDPAGRSGLRSRTRE
ncbi:MAG: hypothetical protein ACJ77D_09780 [Chloroflexota bacterium]